jgi:hypothetical protein
MKRVGTRAACLLWAGLTLGGCAATEKLIPSSDGGGSVFGNLLAFNTTKPGPVPAAARAEVPLECPKIDVLDGTASYRTYAGTDQTNSNVRYQFSMGDVARDCTKSGSQILLKVGVEGRVLLGPAGNAGSFTVPVRIAVRHDSDGKAAATKLYQVPASIAAGSDATAFQVVSDPIAVPFISNSAGDDYTILVGFDAAPKPSAATAGKERRGRRGKDAVAPEAGKPPQG